jgi:hypothetical protein
MKVKQVLAVLKDIDPENDVAVEQIFTDRGRSIELCSIEIVNNCVVFKDHYVRQSQASVFISYNGQQFEISVLPERMLKQCTR